MIGNLSGMESWTVENWVWLGFNGSGNLAGVVVGGTGDSKESYPALGLCQIASGFSVRSGSEPNVDPTKWLFSLIWDPELVTSPTLPPEVDRAWEECCSLTEFSSSVRYLKYTSLCRKLGKNTWNLLRWQRKDIL